MMNKNTVCLKCGYVLTDFEKECRRCKRASTLGFQSDYEKRKAQELVKEKKEDTPRQDGQRWYCEGLEDRIQSERKKITYNLFSNASRFIIQIGYLNISALQRKFLITYYEAAAMGVLMEDYGIVEVRDGIKPQKVLMTRDELELLLSSIAPGNVRSQKESIDKVAVEKPQHPGNEGTSALDELNNMIGLDNIKADVSSFANFLKVQQLRRTKGLSIPQQNLHMVFTGNPGTGKTTVARIIARILNELGVLSKGHLIETDRSGLVGGYLGQTALKVGKIVDSALGGVLFIDEAYALTPKNGLDMFGQEAVSTLIKLMEDHRNNIVVIVAGYSDNMKTFLESNPGIASRFNRTLNFEDYSPNEMVEIFIKLSVSNDYIVTDNTSIKLFNLFSVLHNNRDKNFGNGRTVRNLFEKTISRQADRISSNDLKTANKTSLSTILPVDLVIDEEIGDISKESIVYDAMSKTW